jgi:hypothetical protein
MMETKIRKICSVLAGAAVVVCAPPLVSAHHSVALQFDMSQEIEIEGTIMELEWRNPHAWLTVEAENEAGETVVWRVEFGSGNSLTRRGWRPADLPVGSHVTVHGLPARDGSNTIAGEEVILDDGRELFTGSNPQ